MCIEQAYAFTAEYLFSSQVHERSVDGDFLLLELKELLHTHPTLKVILMSATINQETFVKYFNGAPLLSIPGMTHPVTDKYEILHLLWPTHNDRCVRRYLEDYLPSLSYRAPPSKGPRKRDEDEQDAQAQYISSGLSEQNTLAIQSIMRSDRLDYEVIRPTVPGHRHAYTGHG